MSNKILVDPNIFVYTRDRSAPEKQGKAQQILDELVELRTGVISTQVLGEFFNAITAPKFSNRIEVGKALEALQALIDNWEVKEITPFVVLEAARGATTSRNKADSLIRESCCTMNNLVVLGSSALLQKRSRAKFGQATSAMSSRFNCSICAIAL